MYARRISDREKFQLVLACRSSGMSVSAWCRAHDVPRTTLLHWEKVMQEQLFSGIPTASQDWDSDFTETPQIARLDLLPADTALSADAPQAQMDPPAASIEIHVHDIVFRFSGVVDASLYAQTLQTIGGWL